MELLEDCQNGGITIGTLIEETEGEGHPTVSLLEEYCELDTRHEIERIIRIVDKYHVRTVLFKIKRIVVCNRNILWIHEAGIYQSPFR